MSGETGSKTFMDAVLEMVFTCHDLRGMYDWRRWEMFIFCKRSAVD